MENTHDQLCYRAMWRCGGPGGIFAGPLSIMLKSDLLFFPFKNFIFLEFVLCQSAFIPERVLH